MDCSFLILAEFDRKKPVCFFIVSPSAGEIFFQGGESASGLQEKGLMPQKRYVI
jgi:hypothetical protein